MYQSKLTRDGNKNCEVALVIRLHDSKKTFKAGIISGLRLFQSARERNSLTWMEIYWQRGFYASQSGRGLLTVVKAKSYFSATCLLN